VAAHFFDLDGTIFRYHTNKFLHGAASFLEHLYKKGDDIIFIKMLTNVQWDRNIYEDSPCHAHPRRRNQPWMTFGLEGN
jgi:hypothetical protein